MVDPNRVCHMTRMALLEEQDTDNELNIARSRWNDYLLIRILVSLLSGTLSFAALAALVTMGAWNSVSRFVAGHSLRICLLVLIAGYAVYMAGTLILTVVLAWRRYQKAGLRRDAYIRELEQLEE